MQGEARGESEGEEDDHEDDEPIERVEVAESRYVFGESDEDEDQDAEHEPKATKHRSPEESLQGSRERVRSDDEGSEGDAARAEEIVGNEDRYRSDQYESDDERHIEQKPEKPMGPPIKPQVLLRPPPGMPDQIRSALIPRCVRQRSHLLSRLKARRNTLGWRRTLCVGVAFIIEIMIAIHDL